MNVRTTSEASETSGFEKEFDKNQCGSIISQRKKERKKKKKRKKAVIVCVFVMIWHATERRSEQLNSNCQIFIVVVWLEGGFGFGRLNVSHILNTDQIIWNPILHYTSSN
jgi:hypothetical protein